MNNFQSSHWTNILQDTVKKAHSLPLSGKKYVIFSDLHMGNGGVRDDFRINASNFLEILKTYYYPTGYHLVLNGDVEELQKFCWENVRDSWSEHYDMYIKFQNENRFSKILGNHDYILKDAPDDYPFPVYESLHLVNRSGSILVYHGHQFSDFLIRFEKQCRFILKYIAYPLGIMNYTKSPDSRKKIKTESRAYETSSLEGIISIIGHTHRPLFESLSKLDSLKYRLDSLIRNFHYSNEYEKTVITREVISLKKELTHTSKSSEHHISELYSLEGLKPCLFNSGCVIGKRGMTAIELDENFIKLVYWYDSESADQYQDFYGYEQMEIKGTALRKIILNREKLSFIQDKIRLMAISDSDTEQKDLFTDQYSDIWKVKNF